MRVGKVMVVILAITGVFYSSCRKEVYTENYCFQEDILPILVSNCANTGCHNPVDHEEGYDFTTYQGVMEAVVPGHPNQSPIYEVIRGKYPEMPPEDHAKLTAAQVNNIRAWIQFGAPNSSNCNPCDTLDFTYSGRVRPILENWCTGCHNNTYGEGGVNLESYAGVVVVVNNGSLIGSISHDAGFVPMPVNGGYLNQCEVSAIQRWIDAGYPNN